jgi:hypothetical protein
MSDEPAKPSGRVEPMLFERAEGLTGTLERHDPIWGPSAIVTGASLPAIGLVVARAVNILR